MASKVTVRGRARAGATGPDSDGSAAGSSRVREGGAERGLAAALTGAVSFDP